MNSLEFEKRLESALSLELDYDLRVHRDLPDSARDGLVPAAVLILFGYSEESKNGCKPSLLFVRRTEDVQTHKGQIAFPGGHTEPEELNRPEITALRETEEEVGITRDRVKILGRLPQLFTATGYLIQPFVGILNSSIRDLSLKLDPQEIAEAIWAPLDTLLQPGAYQTQKFRVENVDYPIDVYQYRHHRIWGATGSMTKNILDRLESVGTF